jgi:hypothetical protein
LLPIISAREAEAGAALLRHTTPSIFNQGQMTAEVQGDLCKTARPAMVEAEPFAGRSLELHNV